LVIRPFKGKKVKITIQRDRAILMICVGIALVFWFFVKLNKTYKTSRMVNLNYELPQEVAFTEIPPQKVEATLEGRGWNLMSYFLFYQGPSLSLNVLHFQSNSIDRSELMSRIENAVASSLKVTDINHNYIALKYEEKSQKTLPIQLVAEYRFAEGYFQKDSVVLTPDSVVVSGPVSLLEELTNWKTSKLEEKEPLKSDLIKTIPLQAPSKGQISLNPSAIEVQIPVEQFTEQSIFVPVKLINPPDSVRIFPANIQVSFVIGLSQLNTILPSDFELEADLKNIAANSENNTVPVTMTKQPSGLKGLNYSPKSVEFFIISKEEGH